MNLESAHGASLDGAAAGAAVVTRARDLHCAGRSFDAYQALAALGPLAQIRSTDGRIVAGRVASSLGGHRLGDVLHYLALRGEPTHAEAAYYATLNFYSRRGAYPTFRR